MLSAPVLWEKECLRRMSKASSVVASVMQQSRQRVPQSRIQRMPEGHMSSDGTTSWWPAAEHRWRLCAISETAVQRVRAVSLKRAFVGSMEWKDFFRDVLWYICPAQLGDVVLLNVRSLHTRHSWAVHATTSACASRAVDAAVEFADTGETEPTSLQCHWTNHITSEAQEFAAYMQWSAHYRVHRVLEKSLKVLEFWKKNSRPLKVFENRVGPWKVLEFECSVFRNFCILKFWRKHSCKICHFSTTWLYSSLAYLKKLPNVYYI